MDKNFRTAKSELQLENDRVLVTKWSFPPKSETGWHRHNFDYVVVPLTDGSLTLETTEGEQVTNLTKGISYARRVGVEHNVLNKSELEISFIEIELK